MTRIGIAGSGSWATTLGIMLARSGHHPTLWARSPADAASLQADRQNQRFLPEVRFPELLQVTADPAEAFEPAELVLVVVPSVTMRENTAAIAPFVSADTLVVCATKGIDIETGERMTEIIADEAAGVDPACIGALSGPNLAPEIAAGKVATATVAFPDERRARRAQEVLSSDVYRVYTNVDVTGVELGGALKNIIAIGAGFIDGAALGSNAKSAFVTRGLHEITRLGIAMGAAPETFAGLSGMGDLIATCYSNLSRNHRLGQKIAEGKDLETALEELGQIAEGVPTTRAAVRLAQKHGVEMPITETTYRVLFDGASPEQTVRDLMSRRPQPEVRR